jgi:hypothetical protein
VRILQDLEENLLSVFAAKPWRHGFTSCMTFIFRARAKAMSRRASLSSADHGASSSASTTSAAGSVDVIAHVRAQLPPEPKAHAKRVSIDIDHNGVAEQ